LKHAGEQNAPNAICSKNIDMASRPKRLITKRELCQMVPYTPQHILRLEKEGKFPRRVQVGANRVAWLESEVEAWVAARVAERDTAVR
jgi:prophage regulatory protein